MHTPVLLYKSGVQGGMFSRTCFPDVCLIHHQNLCYVCSYKNSMPTPILAEDIGNLCVPILGAQAKF